MSLRAWTWTHRQTRNYRAHQFYPSRGLALRSAQEKQEYVCVTCCFPTFSMDTIWYDRRMESLQRLLASKLRLEKQPRLRLTSVSLQLVD